MGWNCPECRHENDDLMIRCICGLEVDSQSVEATKNDTSIGFEEQSIAAENIPEKRSPVLEKPESNMFFKVKSEKLEKITKKGLCILLVSLFLAIHAIWLAYMRVGLNDFFDILYWLFAFAGIIGSSLALKRRAVGRVLLMVFYALQLVFLYGDGWRIKFSPGLALPMGYMENWAPVPTGFGINLLAILMIILVIRWLRPDQQGAQDEESTKKATDFSFR